MRFDESRKVKMYYKSGNSTMLLCKGLTQLAATSLALYIERFVKQHGVQLDGNFIFSNHGN